MKVCFETFGCRLNRAEALEMQAAFEERGWETTASHADADMVVVRGCSVTARAESDSLKLIEHIREKYPLKRIVATGCLHDKRNEHWLRDLSRGRSRSPLPAVAARIAARTKTSGQTVAPTARAYLKVQDGCSMGCAFCIVPQFRGKARSEHFQDCLDKAKAFVDAGYHEIVVTGCNLSMYHADGKGLSDLAVALAELDPGCRIRLSSVEPGQAALSLVDAMAATPGICRFLHLPVQSASAMMLSSMRRPYTMKLVDEIMAKAVRLMPGIAIGCDLMTGFPGETELDFLATKLLFNRHPIAKAHIFPYSERPGTLAEHFPGVISRSIRKERAHELAKIADAERTRYAKRFIGKDVEFVVEDEEQCAGWSSEYLWCVATSMATARPKRRELVKMRVLETQGHMLTGRVERR